ncbi:hypothetical protein L596_000162 [Steinernema carpocapsae]|uniref:Uncharacterized protein n=1 Tax=Steinernema carpocapsae TaxID=34508 RepID=A0A4U8UI34_STECR|nr:hypothetical protein L596_000162 [Steinernema carpocapsae]
MMNLFVVVFVGAAALVSASIDYDVPLNNEPLSPYLFPQFVKKSDATSTGEYVPSDIFGSGYRKRLQPKNSKSIRADSKHPLCFFTGLPCSIYQ